MTRWRSRRAGLLEYVAGIIAGGVVARTPGRRRGEAPAWVKARSRAQKKASRRAARTSADGRPRFLGAGLRKGLHRALVRRLWRRLRARGRAHRAPSLRRRAAAWPSRPRRRARSRDTPRRRPRGGFAGGARRRSRFSRAASWRLFWPAGRRRGRRRQNILLDTTTGSVVHIDFARRRTATSATGSRAAPFRGSPTRFARGPAPGDTIRLKRAPCVDACARGTSARTGGRRFVRAPG